MRAEYIRGAKTYDSLVPDMCYIVAKDEALMVNKEGFIRLQKKDIETILYELQNIKEDMDIWLSFEE